MQITTGILEHHGAPFVGIRIQENDDDENCISYVLDVNLARKVAFSLMERADELDPPWEES